METDLQVGEVIALVVAALAGAVVPVFVKWLRALVTRTSNTYDDKVFKELEDAFQRDETPKQ